MTLAFKGKHLKLLSRPQILNKYFKIFLVHQFLLQELGKSRLIIFMKDLLTCWVKPMSVLLCNVCRM